MLSVAEIKTAVTVTDDSTLVDPHRASNVIRLGSDTIDNRQTSLPGRSIIDLVNSQPGWLFEGNAVLHPRGSEYNTQFVIDGIPLTDNRSPSFGPEIEADDVQSLSIYTAGFPAEYGRKLGGVVDIQTARDTRPGFHGDFVASGGSFSTANGYLLGQYSWDKNTLTASIDGATTERYLNPPVVQNFTNTGTTGSFSLRYERDLSDDDRVTISVTHELSRFEVPNELVQQLAGQRQDRGIFETMGIISYQHIFSPNVVGELRLMSRDDSDYLNSNPLSTPIIAFQNRGFRETYLKGSLTIHKGINEWKAGFEGDANHLYESFSDVITDFTQFDPGTPASFQFLGRHWDLEQSAYVQDQISLGKWTINAGVRWDHYELIARKEALSPRIGVARYIKSADVVLHASYDRVFQTPAFENILVSSSPQVESLNPNFLRLPVPPSLGNYYEVGVTKGFFQKLRLDVNVFDRRVNNYSDDDQLLNTAVSFPISFAKARLYGTEAKLDLPHWGRLSGYASYSYIVGSAYFPVTGGLFLGQDVAGTLSGVGRFWDSQDQRNTVRARYRYEVTKRVWAAIAGEYGSGLPVAFDGTYADAVAEYGQAVVNRVNLAHGRVRPSLSIDASVGADLMKTEKLKMSVQADVQDLNDRLNVIDFAGLFSGNAIAPSRSYAVRLKMKF
jgi:outer membrane receptor for Fe3+-dicitrate